PECLTAVARRGDVHVTISAERVAPEDVNALIASDGHARMTTFANTAIGGTVHKYVVRPGRATVARRRRHDLCFGVPKVQPNATQQAVGARRHAMQSLTRGIRRVVHADRTLPCLTAVRRTAGEHIAILSKS